MGEQSATAEDLIISDLQAQVRELKAELADSNAARDLAVAHDSQPYPTAESYEAACLSLNQSKARVVELEASLDGLQTEANALRRERDLFSKAFKVRHETSILCEHADRMILGEREACARVADIEAGEAVDDWTNQNAAKGSHIASKRIAAAIRSRGSK